MDDVDALRSRMGRLSESDRAFAQSLLDQSTSRGLSDRQMAWVRKLSERAIAKAVTIDVSGIVAFLDMAAELLKRPQVRLRAGEDLDIRLSIAGPKSRTPGAVNVTSAEKAYDQRTFYGRIGRDGRFDPSLAIEPETQTAIVAALRALATDPAKAAAAYGRLTGACCFCDLPLSDGKSLQVGYGRTCARRYGLPWGAAAA